MMGEEFQQIVLLAENLSSEELGELADLFRAKLNEQKPTHDFEFSEADKAEIRERFRMIDSGETTLSPWVDVKKRVFGEG
jgi:hypothetical protein